MKQLAKWKEICELPKGPERNKKFQEIRKEYGLYSANDFEKILKEHAKKADERSN